jgi:hypothetical protein
MITKAVSKSRRLVARSRKARASVQHLIETSQQTIRDSQRLIERATPTCNDTVGFSKFDEGQDEYTMLRGTMTTHKFSVDQEVSFSPDRDQKQQYTEGELFRIVRLLPEAGGALQYRVKSEVDGRERVVREDQLAGG